MALLHEDRLLPGVADWADELVAIRRDFHMHPEEGFDTERTCGVIVEKLKAWGADEIDTDTVKGCVVAVINGNRPGVTIGLRGDIDCLPMDDTCGQPWASTHPGKGHCCGHDGHATWTLGVARWFAENRDFPGRVVVFFEAAEEKGKGALAMVNAGLMEKYQVAEVYAAHSETNLPAGQFGMKPGPLQASADAFFATIHGVGAHGGRPHQGVDPIPVAGQVIGAVQTLVSRKIDPMETAVVSICSVNAGRYEAMNVIPSQCTLSGTVRTYLPEIRDMIESKLETMIKGIAEVNGCTADFEYRRLVSAVINDVDCAEAAIAATEKLLGAENVVRIPAFMSSEDFSEFMTRAPGMVVRVGQVDENHNANLHNGAFDFNDAVLPVAVSVLANMVNQRLYALA